ncbi:NUDIX domain-containing protein [Solirubrobacter soli]|uniref:NUDIX domain-containing protein n=1 Tax=Solirubrobacter soli TaxID=363832 RepID=UPI00040D78DC|nr:NUDIX domain-containing protein [Solirubrobacter soli]
MSLNPALEDIHFCPRCGKTPTVNAPRSITCAHCGYGAFYNPKPVAVVIPVTETQEIILMRRGFEPQRGHWSLPSGFVDLGETVETAAVREVKEELDLRVEITGLVGVYSRAEDRTVVVVYAAAAKGIPSTSEEALEVRAFAPIDIPWQDLAFWSEERALVDYLGSRSRPARS